VPPQFNEQALAGLKPKAVEEKFVELAEQLYQEKEKEAGAENMRLLERLAMLRTIDNLWVEHLTAMEYMRQEAQWKTLQQMKATDAYKIMGGERYDELVAAIKRDIARTIFHLRLAVQEPAQTRTRVSQAASAGAPSKKLPAKVSGRKVGRNDPCPCGSGKKYKHCCGK
jgi:preprotein translocase subunit SecA